MKKIIIRSGMAPFDKHTATDMLMRNIMGGNIGNLVYANSVYRAVMTEDVEVESDHYRLERKLTSEEIDEINQTCSMYLIPLADAFRLNFGDRHTMASNIRKLNIPVVVVGVGVRNKLEAADDFSSLDPIKDSAKEFISEVLKHSAVVGTRGEATLRYLKGLGFSDQEIRPIGCPSMYTFGPELKIKPLELTKDSNILVNNSPDTVADVHKFMRRVMKDYPNYTFIPQRDGELKELFLGAPFKKKPLSSKPLYPYTIDDPAFSEGRARFFLSATSWIEYARDKALSVGPRLHGGVAPLISGIPSVIIAKDIRMKELVDFHSLPHVERSMVNGDVALEDLLSKVDFETVQKKQKANFDNYVDFLNANEVPNIYSDPANPNPTDTKYDKRIAEIKFVDPVKPILSCTEKEMAARWYEYYPRLEKWNAKKKTVTIKPAGKKDEDIKFGDRMRAAAKIMFKKEKKGKK